MYIYFLLIGLDEQLHILQPLFLFHDPWLLKIVFTRTWLCYSSLGEYFQPFHIQTPETEFQGTSEPNPPIQFIAHVLRLLFKSIRNFNFLYVNVSLIQHLFDVWAWLFLPLSYTRVHLAEHSSIFKMWHRLFVARKK